MFKWNKFVAVFFSFDALAPSDINCDVLLQGGVWYSPHSNCKKYCQCGSNLANPNVMDCPDGTSWNNVVKTCAP